MKYFLCVVLGLAAAWMGIHDVSGLGWMAFFALCTLSSK